jgi:hypothetical protein
MGEHNLQSDPLAFDPRIEDQVNGIAAFVRVHRNNDWESIVYRVQFDEHGSTPRG